MTSLAPSAAPLGEGGPPAVDTPPIDAAPDFDRPDSLQSPRPTTSAPAAPQTELDSDNRDGQRQALGNLVAALSRQQTTDHEPTQQQIDQVTTFTAATQALNQPDFTSIGLPAETYLPNPLPMDDVLGYEFPTFTDQGDNHTLLPNSSFQLAQFADPASFANMNEENMNEEPATTPPPSRRIGAYARLSFEDGVYYMSTFAIELGRDAIAYRDAMRRETEQTDGLQERVQKPTSRMSRHSDRIKRDVESQVQGSLVSEMGGFAGLDDQPVGLNEGVANPRSHVSQSSQSSGIVNPGLLSLRQNGLDAQFDYDRRVEELAEFEGTANAIPRDHQQPAPVTAAHLPDPNICPLIPIHTTVDHAESEVKMHKRISRRHVRISWDPSREEFMFKVLGRNGAFLDNDLECLKEGTEKPLRHGSVMQIEGIQIRFDLPHLESSEASLPSIGGSPERPGSITPISTPERQTPTPKATTKITNNNNEVTPTPSQSAPLIGSDGQPIKPRRGPGRPPKDGLMSQRERKERKKAEQAALAKAANGGTTPPPKALGKPMRPPSAEELSARQKEKGGSSSGKRKREGEGDVLPSIEGGGAEDLPDDASKQPAKKARQSKSPSPEYPPLESLTEAQLQKPNDPYSRLIYDLLMEIYPRALPLKGIYRALKVKYPYFVYKQETDGWQSSVRHNLNAEAEKLFEKAEKEGKGFSWRAMPGALQPQAERKRAQATVPAKPKPTQHRQQHNNNGMPQPPNWTQNGYQSGNGGAWPQGQGPQAGGNQPARAYPGSGQNASNRAGPPPPVMLPLPPLGAPYMPCTQNGALAILRFGDLLSSRAAKKKLTANHAEQLVTISNSVKVRLLHGPPPATVSRGPDGKGDRFAVLRSQQIVERAKNPAFKGYDTRPPGAVPQSAGVARPQNNGQGRPAQQAAPAMQRPATNTIGTPTTAPPATLGGQASTLHYPPPSQRPQQTPTTHAGNFGAHPQPAQQRPHTPGMSTTPFQVASQRPASAGGSQMRPHTPGAPANPMQAGRAPQQPHQTPRPPQSTSSPQPNPAHMPQPPQPPLSQPQSQQMPASLPNGQHVPPQPQARPLSGNQAGPAYLGPPLNHQSAASINNGHQPLNVPSQAGPPQRQASSVPTPQTQPIQRPAQGGQYSQASGLTKSSDTVMTDAPPVSRPTPYPTVGQVASATSLQPAASLEGGKLQQAYTQSSAAQSSNSGVLGNNNHVGSPMSESKMNTDIDMTPTPAPQAGSVAGAV